MNAFLMSGLTAVLLAVPANAATVRTPVSPVNRGAVNATAAARQKEALARQHRAAWKLKVRAAVIHSARKKGMRVASVEDSPLFDAAYDQSRGAIYDRMSGSVMAVWDGTRPGGGFVDPNTRVFLAKYDWSSQALIDADDNQLLAAIDFRTRNVNFYFGAEVDEKAMTLVDPVSQVVLSSIDTKDPNRPFLCDPRTKACLSVINPSTGQILTKGGGGILTKGGGNIIKNSDGRIIGKVGFQFQYSGDKLRLVGPGAAGNLVGPGAAGN